MKKIYNVVLIMILTLFTVFTFKVNAEQAKIPSTTGDYITYRGSSEYVYINSEYVAQNEFRAVWVSPLVGDISYYNDKASYQKEIISVLDNMEFYNLNVMIFHIRIMNDAFYESSYNNWSVYYNTNPDWEAIPWIIEECHKRGIEFHAWMNPYRVANGTHNLTELSKKFPKSNMASNPDNLLQGANSVILNPGIPEIRNWLVSVCMEVVRKFDVDAIHFDDYFYDYKVDDSATRSKYNTEGLSLGDFRRKQVDDFIEDLSNSIRRYNKENNKCVQLGISPSGVYRSGNGIVTYDSQGNAITNGSNSGTSFIHYDDYLYSDTLKWINEEWIDYILPQAYWAIEHNLCPYADLMKWWSEVAKYKKVNVYAGLGLYQQDSSSSSSWYTNELECYNQIMIANTLENVQGVSFFAYKNVKNAVINTDRMKNVKDIWKREAILPEIQNADHVDPGKVENLAVYKNEAGYNIKFKENDLAKFYVIYRSTKPLTYSPEEVVDVIGALKDENGLIEYTDAVVKSSTKYYYGVRAQSNTLTLGEGTSCYTGDATEGKLSYLGDLNLQFPSGVISGSKISIAFEKIHYQLGNEITYEITYSFDEGAEKTVKQFSYANGNNYIDVNVPKDAKKMNVKLTAKNNIGLSEYAVTMDVIESLANINGFTILGDIYCGKDATFVWHNQNIEGSKYYVQSSTDRFNWQTIKEIDEEIEGLNYRQVLPLLPNTGNQYYRVVIEKDGIFGYSEVLEFKVYEDLGGFKNLLINGSERKDTYYVNEGDEFTISWDKRENNGVMSTEMIMYSYDQKNWLKLSLYSRPQTNITDTSCEYIIPIADTAFKVYFKIISTIGDMKYEEKPIELYVTKSFIFYDEVSTFVYDEQKEFLESMGLFK